MKRTQTKAVKTRAVERVNTAVLTLLEANFLDMKKSLAQDSDFISESGLKINLRFKMIQILTRSSWCKKALATQPFHVLKRH